MSVDTSTRKVSFTCSAVAGYDFTFRALTSAPTDIKAKLKVIATGVETDLTYTTHYTVAVNSNGIGGVLTLVTTYGTTHQLTIYRETTDLQESDYNDYNQFPADTLEEDLDKRTCKSQEAMEDISRALKVAVSSTLSNITIPNPVVGRALIWSTGGVIINSVLDVDTNAIAAATSATAALASQVAAAASAVAANASDIDAAVQAAAALLSQISAATSATLAVAAATAGTIAIAAATTATTQAALAGNYASTASTQAIAAATSATAALNSQYAAATSATAALASQVAAATSATTASSNATTAVTASTSAIASATSATASLAASTAATLAAQVAQYAAQTGATSAIAAATSATASLAASTAATLAAQVSQYAAATSATNALASQVAAATSATAALASQIAAATSSTTAGSFATTAIIAATAATTAVSSLTSASVALSNLITTTIQVDLLPATTATVNLGSPTLYYKNGYINTVSCVNLVVSNSTVAAGRVLTCSATGLTAWAPFPAAGAPVNSPSFTTGITITGAGTLSTIPLSVLNTGSTSILSLRDDGILSLPKQSSAQAYLNATITATTNASATLLPLDVEGWDLQGEMDVTTNKGRFTAKVAGYYQINVCIWWSEVVASSLYGVFVYKNNGEVAPAKRNYKQSDTLIASNLTTEWIGVVSLAAGDYIDIYYYQASGVTTPRIQGNASGLFSGYEIYKVA